jgi:tRNA dimethylallyltransferase
MVQSFVINADANFIMTPKLILVVGPTAIGKTALSIKLASHFNCDIISSDSRQFYKEMAVGTAVPSKEERQHIRHHFIQHKSVTEHYTVGDFEKEAIQKIHELHKTNPYIVMVGGSGLYVKAITDGLDDFPEIDKRVRSDLQREFEEKGINHLQEKLNKIDPAAYNTIALDNPHRVMRALEVTLGTGRPYSQFLSKPKKERQFQIITIGLTAVRKELYDRINRRVDSMMDQGLLNEVKTLVPHQNTNALNTVGYKELFRFLNNEISLDFAISEIKKNTRRFAKRQLTWFSKNKDIKWFDYKTETKTIIRYIESQ